MLNNRDAFIFKAFQIAWKAAAMYVISQPAHRHVKRDGILLIMAKYLDLCKYDAIDKAIVSACLLLLYINTIDHL